MQYCIALWLYLAFSRCHRSKFIWSCFKVRKYCSEVLKNDFIAAFVVVLADQLLLSYYHIFKDSYYFKSVVKTCAKHKSLIGRSCKKWIDIFVIQCVKAKSSPSNKRLQFIKYFNLFSIFLYKFHQWTLLSHFYQKSFWSKSIH